MSAPLVACCVLKSGGLYDPSWVAALGEGLSEHLPGVPLACFTDLEPGAVDADVVIPLREDWPGWWSKMETLRPGTFEGVRVLYLDLDSLPVGPLDGIVGADVLPFGMIADLGSRARRQSGVLLWEPGEVTDALWHAWQMGPPSTWWGRYRGDGEWLHAHAPKGRLLTDAAPGQIVSLKWDARKGPPPGARLVCGHGEPRLNQKAAGWAHDVWRERAMLGAGLSFRVESVAGQEARA